MILSIDAIKKTGSFVGGLTEKEITWTHAGEDHTATVFVRPLSYSSAVADIRAHIDKTDSIAGRIAASICDENGNAIFTIADITGTADPDRGALCEALTLALLAAIGEANSVKQKS